MVQNELPESYLALGYGENLFTTPHSNSTMYLKSIANGDSSANSMATLFSNYSIYLPDPLSVLGAIKSGKIQKEYAPKESDLDEIEKLLLTTLNAFLRLPEERYQIKETFWGYTFIDKKETELSLYQISEGYRTNIVLITDILLKIVSARKKLFAEPILISELFKKAKGTVFIDEFDKHLHPVWQRTFLKELKNQFPNIQFFVTTHNLFAVQSAVGGSLIQLEEGLQTNYTFQKIEARSILGIMRNYFTQELFDYDSQSLLNTFSDKLEEIYNGNLELTYSNNFKSIVEQIYNKGNELQSIIASQLLQLNETLKHYNKKEFLL